MKRILVLTLGIFVCLLGSTAVASPGNAALLSTTLQAVLAQAVNVSVAHAGAGTGTTVPDVGDYEYNVGDPITLSATPDAGSYFAGWHVDLGSGAFTLDDIHYVINSTVPSLEVVATASFATTGYTLTVGVRGEGTVDPPAGTYAFVGGVNVLVGATPSGSAVFSHWEDGTGATVGTGSPTAAFMDSDQVRIAVFETPITGGILINNNRSATNNRDTTLSLTWGGGAGTGVVRMRFSDDGSHWTAWEPLADTRPYTLPAGADGHKTVRVQYLDKLNNKSAIFSDYIRLDTIPPTGTIIINGGAATTTSQNVTLGLTWVDTGALVSRMRFSDDGAHWTNWMLPTATSAHTLPAGLGYHTVRVQYLDGAGNYSLVYNDYIRLIAP